MKKTILALSVVFGLCAAGADVHAQEEPGSAKSAAGKRGGKVSQQTQAGLMKICAADMTRFCNGVEPGPKLGKCLLENEDELAPACLVELKKMPSGQKGKGGGGKGGKDGANPEAEAALNKSCKADLVKFCKDTQPGPEQGQCLMEHEAELSAECGKTLKSLPPPEDAGGPDQAGQGGQGQGAGGGDKKAGAALMKACKADADKFCKDIQPGPEQGQCLMEHEAELSAECGKTLKSLPPPGGEGGKSGKSGGGAALMKACKADMNKFCKDFPPGPQRGRCLKEHEGELSAECAKTFKNMPPPPEEGGGEAGQGRQGQGRGGQERPGQGKGGQRKGGSSKDGPGKAGPGEGGQGGPVGH